MAKVRYRSDFELTKTHHTSKNDLVIKGSDCMHIFILQLLYTCTHPRYKNWLMQVHRRNNSTDAEPVRVKHL